MKKLLHKVKHRSLHGNHEHAPADNQDESVFRSSPYHTTREASPPSVDRRRSMSTEPKRRQRLHRSSWTFGQSQDQQYQEQERSAPPSADGRVYELASGVDRLKVNSNGYSEHSPAHSRSSRTPQRAPIGATSQRRLPSPDEQSSKSSIRRKAVGTSEPNPLKPLPADPPPTLVSKDHIHPAVRGIIDLNNTADTIVEERIAPAAVVETVNKEIHHIRHEQIIQEIHDHEVFHRILPIIDVEVLPARHFVPSRDGTLVEVPESALPGRAIDSVHNWVIAETVSKIPSTAPPPSQPRQFTARKFEGTDGDYREWVTDDNVKHSETTWVHPPVADDSAMLAGQTVPIHFGLPEAQPIKHPALRGAPQSVTDRRKSLENAQSR